MTAKIFTFANQKGGVGKTSSTINVAHGLARLGRSVLIVDFDPQGQCATVLGLNPEPGVFNLLVYPGGNPHQWVRETGRENLYIIPGDRATATAQIVLNAESRDISAVASVIAPFAREYDYILFDTAPSAGGLQERAIWASRFVIIPTATEFLSTDGLSQIVTLLGDLTTRKGWMGELMGVLPTFYDTQTRQSKIAITALRKAFDQLCLPPIRRSTILRECPSEGVTVWEKDSDCMVAGDYKKLVDLVARK